MSAGEKSNGGSASTAKSSSLYRVMVTLNGEQMAAAEGWRRAHRIEDQSEALGELIRLGLLGEVAKIYHLVSDHDTGRNARSRNGDAK